MRYKPEKKPPTPEDHDFRGLAETVTGTGMIGCLGVMQYQDKMPESNIKQAVVAAAFIGSAIFMFVLAKHNFDEADRRRGNR